MYHNTFKFINTQILFRVFKKKCGLGVIAFQKIRPNGIYF